MVGGALRAGYPLLVTEEAQVHLVGRGRVAGGKGDQDGFDAQEPSGDSGRLVLGDDVVSEGDREVAAAVAKRPDRLVGFEFVDDRARWSALFEAVTGNADNMSVIGRIASKAVLLAKDGIGLGTAVTEDGWTGIF